MSATTSTPAPSRHAEIARRYLHGRSVVRDPQISRGGAHVAFVVATIDVDTNTTRSTVWIDDVAVSAGPKDSSPCWSPDGRSLAFVRTSTDPGGHATLQMIPVDRPGETRQLCSMPDGISDASWSPDGRWIGFTSRTRHHRYEHDQESWQPPRKVERFFARLDDEGWIEDRPSHVYVVPTDGTAPPRNLTPGPFQHSGVAWLADSSGVVTSAQRHDSWDRDFAQDIHVVPLDADTRPEAIRCLTAHDGVHARPSVSPDGSRVAFVGYADPSTYPQNSHIGVVSVDASDVPSSDIVWASSGMDRTFEATSCHAAPIWESDTTILAVADDRGESPVFRIAADGSTAPVRVTVGPHTILAISAGGGHVATVRSTVTMPGELFVDDDRRTTVTEGVGSASTGWERFIVPTTDGTDEIDAWIMRPTTDTGGPHPVLLNVHGGPFTQYGEVFFDEAQMQAAAGFVVVMCNPRGGSGRDTAWGQSILGPEHPVQPGTGWGSVDVDDVLAVLDAALERFSDVCDRGRVGMIGGSYGGFMATWLAAHHGDRFRAICSERSVNNLLSEEWSSDCATMFRTEFGPPHLDSPDAYTSRSPIAHVRDITTPMLLIHSEDDLRCPIIQAEELWVALRLLDRDVEFYRFPGEGHELSRSGSPIHRVQRGEIILDWFADRLGLATVSENRDR